MRVALASGTLNHPEDVMNRFVAPLFSLLAAALVSLAPTPAAAQSCAASCQPGTVCNPSTRQCVSACNPLCADNEVCSPAGQCVSRCNPVCAAGQTCLPDGTCKAPVQACFPNCRAGFVCRAGACVASGRPNGGALLAPPPAPVGGGRFTQPQTIIAPGAPVMERHDRGMYVGGIVSSSLGGAAAVAGIALMILATDSEEYCVYGTGNCWMTDDDDQMAAGAGVFGLGIAAVITGAVLAAIGGKRVPVTPHLVDSDSLKFSIQPTLGGGHATLTF